MIMMTLAQDEPEEACPLCGSTDLVEIPNGTHCVDCGCNLDVFYEEADDEKDVARS
jgi:rubredoxin